MSRIVVLTILVAIGSFFFLGSPTARPALAVSCADFATQAEAQEYLRTHPWDSASVESAVGIACKDLPCPCNRFPVTNTNVPSPTPTPTYTPTSTATAVATSTPIPQPSSTTAAVPTATASTGGGLQAPVSQPASQATTRSVILPPSTGDAGLR